MKLIPFAGRLSFCLVLAALAVLIGRIAPLSAQEIECSRYLPPKNQEWYKPGEIKAIQEILKDKVNKDLRIDGILGDDTIVALKKYCISSDDQSPRQDAEERPRADDTPLSYQLTQKDLEDQRQARKVYEDLKETVPSRNKNELNQLIDEAKKNLPERFHPFVKIRLRNLSDQDSSAPYEIDKDSLESIARELIPETVLEKLESLAGVEYPSLDLFDNAIELIADVGSKVPDQSGIDREQIYQLAEKEHLMDQPFDIQWESGQCGCTPVFKRVVYGFYPYWTPADLSDEAEAPKQVTIHYSALSRIGFYALFMDQSGEWRTPGLWEKQSAAFIKKARKYGVKVDLVIHNPDWLLATADHSAEIITELTHLVRQTYGCDGITLYFDEFPADGKSLQPFKDFLKQLYATSKRGRRPFFVNLMLPPDSFEKEEKGKRLMDFLSIFDKEDDIFVDLLIEFLYEPTSENKKELRYRIEQKFSGLQRRNMFRKVVPVISPPLYSDDQQFKDDLIYFEDNFGGIAFWPMLTGKDEHTVSIKNYIRAAYKSASNQSADSILLEDKVSANPICVWLCPNRIVAMWIIAAGFLLFTCGALVSTRICAWRDFFKRCFWYVLGGVVLLVMLLLSLLTCVPGWSRYTTIVSIAIAAALTLFIVFRQIQRIKKEKYP